MLPFGCKKRCCVSLGHGISIVAQNDSSLLRQVLHLVHHIGYKLFWRDTSGEKNDMKKWRSSRLSLEVHIAFSCHKVSRSHQ